jgi:hypothetical protein
MGHKDYEVLKEKSRPNIDKIKEKFKYVLTCDYYQNILIFCNELQKTETTYILLDGIFFHEDESISHFDRLVLDKQKIRFLEQENQQKIIDKTRRRKT